MKGRIVQRWGQKTTPAMTRGGGVRSPKYFLKE